jgi:hypothetical protein
MTQRLMDMIPSHLSTDIQNNNNNEQQRQQQQQATLRHTFRYVSCKQSCKVQEETLH